MWPDWLTLKAQYYQESRLDPAAVSPAGARGIAQFMPATFAEAVRALGWGAVSPHDARFAIEAGAWYMARLCAGWSSPRPTLDRQQLAQASYNAGMGNLLRAQAACGGAVRWPAVAACLPSVTGRHAQETLTYVDRIARWRAVMMAGRR